MDRVFQCATKRAGHENPVRFNRFFVWRWIYVSSPSSSGCQPGGTTLSESSPGPGNWFCPYPGTILLFVVTVIITANLDRRVGNPIPLIVILQRVHGISI